MLNENIVLISQLVAIYTSRTRSSVQAEKFPQLQYDQVVPWWQRRVVLSPVKCETQKFNIYKGSNVHASLWCLSLLEKGNSAEQVPEKQQTHIPRYWHPLLDHASMHLQI